MLRQYQRKGRVMQGQTHRKGRVCLDSSRGKEGDARTIVEEREGTQGQFQGKGGSARAVAEEREGVVRNILEEKKGAQAQY
jgi:hypothetical protein